MGMRGSGGGRSFCSPQGSGTLGWREVSGEIIDLSSAHCIGERWGKVGVHDLLRVTSCTLSRTGGRVEYGLNVGVVYAY
eukprot:766999-Hanusia_phi.AAC.3